MPIPLPKVDCPHCHIRQTNHGQYNCTSCGKSLYDGPISLLAKPHPSPKHT